MFVVSSYKFRKYQYQLILLKFMNQKCFCLNMKFKKSQRLAQSGRGSRVAWNLESLRGASRTTSLTVGSTHGGILRTPGSYYLERKLRTALWTRARLAEERRSRHDLPLANGAGGRR